MRYFNNTLTIMAIVAEGVTMRFNITIALVAASLLLGGCGGSANMPGPIPGSIAQATRAEAPAFSASRTIAAPQLLRWWENDIGPRFQWNANYGYCGEVSFISAGLYYGQYASQYDARAAASSAPQNKYRSQLQLVYESDSRAAQVMHLSVIRFHTNTEQSTDEFLAWVKQNVVLGRPVVIGIYMNYYLFYGDKNPNAGSDYDHIVPVVGIGSKHPLTDPRYYPDDVIDFSDNGEWGTGPRGDRRYYFTYPFGTFQKSRQEANAPNGTIYSIDDKSDYGVTITGVVDQQHETLPVRVTTNVNYEHPSIVNGSSVRPPPMPIVLTVTVSGMRPGAQYKLYRYNSWDAIPDGRFNANAGNAFESWTIQSNSGDTYTMTEPIESDEIAAYRAVPIDAP
jgi:hypothetical protein